MEMDQTLCRSYLTLLRDLNKCLEQLSQLAQDKTGAVRQNDLLRLDEIMKQEQAMTLNLRGLEQKRLRLTAQLGLDGVPLTGLPARFPAALRPQASQDAERLYQSYQLYRSCAEVARNTLECNLHEIEKIIAASGIDPAQAGAGYTAPGAEPPKNMKTDFRA